MVYKPVSCAIMQKNGAGLQTATACYWDPTTDGKRLLKFCIYTLDQTCIHEIN